MTRYQKQMIAYLKAMNTSCAMIGGAWCWAEDFRRDARLAERCYRLLTV